MSGGNLSVWLLIDNSSFTHVCTVESGIHASDSFGTHGKRQKKPKKRKESSVLSGSRAVAEQLRELRLVMASGQEVYVRFCEKFKSHRVELCKGRT
ncbi:hypothetical protein YC2023_043551 [Brassica napus]